jgi:putative tricarboxylic transport membrane protein
MSPRRNWQSTPRSSGRARSKGVAGPEAANNASAAGTLVPMLSLGLPTNATAAVMLAAMTWLRHPARVRLLFEEQCRDLVWALIASLFIGNALLARAQPAARAAVGYKLLRTPRPYLYAGILFFASLGAYAVNLQWFDLASCCSSSGCWAC